MGQLCDRQTRARGIMRLRRPFGRAAAGNFIFERDRLGSKGDLHAAEAIVVAVGFGCNPDDCHLSLEIQPLDRERLESALNAVQERGSDLLDALCGQRQQRDDQVGVAGEGLKGRREQCCVRTGTVSAKVLKYAPRGLPPVCHGASRRQSRRPLLLQTCERVSLTLPSTARPRR